jgi:hypothetical protein
MPRGTSSSKRIDTIPHSATIAQNEPAAAGGHPMLNPYVSNAVMRSPAAWKLSTFYFPRLRCAPPRKRLRRGAFAPPSGLMRGGYFTRFPSAPLRSASGPLHGGCAPFGPHAKLFNSLYSPVQFGLRFCENASGPSMESFECHSFSLSGKRFAFASSIESPSPSIAACLEA